MANNLDNLRKKLLYRSTHRGCKETDFLLGDFAINQIDKLTDKELNEFQDLLNQSDNDIYNWITGIDNVPESLQNGILNKIILFNKENVETIYKH
jgi:antitoxin CptB